MFCLFVCLFPRARKQGNSKKLKQFLEYIWVRVCISIIAPISATPQRCLRSSKLTICWPSHFVILLCDSNRSTIRRFSVPLSKSENSFELQIIFKMLIFISVISLTRGKSKGSSRNFRVSCYSSGGHKTHHFHLITLDILCLSSPACVSSKLLSKVAQIWRQGLMNVILSQVFWRQITYVGIHIWYKYSARVSRLSLENQVKLQSLIPKVKACHAQHKVRQSFNCSRHDSSRCTTWFTGNSDIFLFYG